MERQSRPDEVDDAIRDSRQFPMRGVYIVLIVVLSALSLLKLSFQTDNVPNGPWKMFVDVGVTSLTLTILLLAWLPLVIPWIVRLLPHFRGLVRGLREMGIQEIETGIVKIKLVAGIEEAARQYDQLVLSREPGAAEPNSQVDLDRSYRATVASLERVGRIKPSEAMARIDELCSYYDRVRDTMPPGRSRTRLMTDIASTMWALMPSVDEFPLYGRLKSQNGGERLSAYKYAEWSARASHIALLTARAIGVLETPFGQYHALLALRRIVAEDVVNRDTMILILGAIGWAAGQELYGRDRQALVNLVERQLRHALDAADEGA